MRIPLHSPALRILQRQVILFLLLLLLVSCEGIPELPFLPGNGELTPTGAVGTNTPESVQTPAVDSPTPDESAEPPLGVHLKIWLPPQFDPNAGTPAAELLKARLEQFQVDNPNVTVEVRLKAITGPGGLLDSLTTANAAAPLAIPDLIALPQSLLESAVMEGLIYPFDGLTTAMEDYQWYEYARQLGRQQNGIYGLPFIGDALVMAYQPALVATPPADWETTSAISNTLAFTAADPQALFTMVEYQAAGGVVQNEQGQPTLDENSLLEVLNFFQIAERAQVMPFWLTQFETTDQVWESFSGQQSSMAVSWFSDYVKQKGSLPVEMQLAVLPTPNGRAYTFATGWVWAIASIKPDRHELGARLAEYLLDDTFLGQWSSAVGYLPPHGGALATWQDAQVRSLVNRIQTSAHLLPPTGVISKIGPFLRQATVDVLKEQSDPITAAKTALENMTAP